LTCRPETLYGPLVAENDKAAAERLRRFLIRLASEHKMLWDYVQDPRGLASAQEHGLEVSYVELVVTANAREIRNVLQQAGFGDDCIAFGTGVVIHPVKASPST
jgi:hypothetical protein